MMKGEKQLKLQLSRDAPLDVSRVRFVHGNSSDSFEQLTLQIQASDNCKTLTMKTMDDALFQKVSRVRFVLSSLNAF